MSAVFLFIGIVTLVFWLCMIGWTLEQCEPQWFQVPKTLDIEAIRKQAKDDGLVLHLPSYAEGVEAYIEPKWQKNPYSCKEHLLRV
jgi:hypothetical protein